MESRIVLTADSKEELNKLIDDKLKQSYLLSGGMYPGEQEALSQIMVLSNNIDEEFTLAGGVKLVIWCIMMYLIFRYVL